MALLFMDGLNYYTDGSLRWTFGMDCSISVGGGRFGGNALRTPGTTGAYWGRTEYAQTFLTASYGTLIAGAAVKNTAPTATGARYLSFYDGGTEQCYVGCDSLGRLTLYQGGNLLGTGTTIMAANAYYYVEMKVVFGASGSAVVHLNGGTEISVSGVATKTSANSYANSLFVGGIRSGDMLHCDIYVCDASGSANNDFLGDVRIETLFPTGAGAETQWAPSTGANWQNVDEVPANGDTDYNKSATIGQVDTYAMGNLASASGIVYGVQYLHHVRKDNGGSRIAAPVARIGGTDYAGSDLRLGDTYGYLREIKEASPATSGLWTISEINAMEFGIKVTA